MKLITETFEDVKFLTEAADGGGKNYFIEGVFMQSDTLNRNKRMYPTQILMNEARRYDREYVQNKRAIGELNHTTNPIVNLDRVSHIILEFMNNGKDIHGRAKIMDTPMGEIVKSLNTEGASLGVSARELS